MRKASTQGALRSAGLSLKCHKGDHPQRESPLKFAGPQNIKVEINIHGSGAHETAATLKSENVLDAITHAIQVALKGCGHPDLDLAELWRLSHGG